MTSLLRGSALGLAFIASVALSSCDGNSTEPRGDIPASLQKVSGDEQEGTVGQLLEDPLVVRVLDDDGDPVSGVLVSFAITSGGGSLSASSGVTNASGNVEVRWTLGTSTLTEPRVEARVADSETGESIAHTTFTAVPLPGAAASLHKAEGDAQPATVGEPVPTIPVVLVRDQYGNPVPGVTVTFTIVSGGGTIQNASVMSDDEGLASVGRWTLGPVAEPQSLRASATGLTPVVFTVTAQPGPGMRFVVEGTPPTSAASGAAFGPIVLRLQDAYGNFVPLSNIGVTASVSAGDGTLTGPVVAITNAEGRATFQSLTMIGSPGQKTLLFSSGNLTAVSIPFTLTAGTAAQLVKLGGDGQQIPAGGTASTAPSVRVTDAANNPLAGVTVTFAIASGGGSVTGATATTDAQGVARVGSWTVGGTMGNASLTASVPGVDPATFTATIVPGAPAVLEKYAGDNQTANVNTQVPIPLRVRVLDAYGNPVPEVTVVFSVTSGGGLIVGPNGFTNALGIASIGDWTLGPTPGTNTARAAIGDLSVTFTATATAVPTP